MFWPLQKRAIGRTALDGAGHPRARTAAGLLRVAEHASHSSCGSRINGLCTGEVSEAAMNCLCSCTPHSCASLTAVVHPSLQVWTAQVNARPLPMTANCAASSLLNHCKRLPAPCCQANTCVPASRHSTAARPMAATGAWSWAALNAGGGALRVAGVLRPVARHEAPSVGRCTAPRIATQGLMSKHGFIRQAQQIVANWGSSPHPVSPSAAAAEMRGCCAGGCDHDCKGPTCTFNAQCACRERPLGGTCAVLAPAAGHCGARSKKDREAGRAGVRPACPSQLACAHISFTYIC